MLDRKNANANSDSASDVYMNDTDTDTDTDTNIHTDTKASPTINFTDIISHILNGEKTQQEEEIRKKQEIKDFLGFFMKLLGMDELGIQKSFVLLDAVEDLVSHVTASSSPPFPTSPSCPPPPPEPTIRKRKPSRSPSPVSLHKRKAWRKSRIGQQDRQQHDTKHTRKDAHNDANR